MSVISMGSCSFGVAVGVEIASDKSLIFSLLSVEMGGILSGGTESPGAILVITIAADEIVAIPATMPAVILRPKCFIVCPITVFVVSPIIVEDDTAVFDITADVFAAPAIELATISGEIGGIEEC